ncbi:RHS repeat-associated core domain-containing protein [Chryseobacterium sp. POE27]|uniref:RHS repeat domain-containing protein n=1 Tax=Chryseobacterium sp. POE27 TaxID=3138177 RepID=UPI00321AC538
MNFRKYNNLKNQYIYSYTDHLGNVRLSYFRNATSGSADVLEENNYYAFGLKYDANFISSRNPSSYNYQYNGKELQTETGWNDFGARMYMSDIGRWGVIDPLAEQMRRYSPYNYAFNNPVNYVDPDGMAATKWDIYGHWDFDPNTTIMGGDFFEGMNTSANRMSLWQNPGSGIGGTTYYGQEAYNVLQSFLNPQNYFEGIDFSQFGEGTNNDGNPAAFWYFDKKGEQLMNHWLGGSGKNLSFSYDKSWTNYVSKNGFVQDELYKRALARSYMMYSEKKGTYSETSGNFHFEIDNTYNTGYGMLHGTKYFSYVLNGTYDKKSDSYIFKYNLKWTDQINHNQNVLLDRAFNSFTRAVAHPKDYWITIKWTQTIIIKSKEWEELH